MQSREIGSFYTCRGGVSQRRPTGRLAILGDLQREARNAIRDYRPRLLYAIDDIPVHVRLMPMFVVCPLFVIMGSPISSC